MDINLRDGERSYALVDEIPAPGVPVVVITGYTNVSPAEGKVGAGAALINRRAFPTLAGLAAPQKHPNFKPANDHSTERQEHCNDEESSPYRAALVGNSHLFVL